MAPGLRCTVCTHPERAAIDRAVLSRSVRDIAKQWGLTSSSVQRHKGKCVKKTVERAARASNIAVVASGAATLDRIESILVAGRELLELGLGKRDPETGKLARQRYPGDPDGADIKGASTAFVAVLRALEVIAKIRGEIQPGSSTVNVLVDARGKPREEWAQVLGAILDALRPYPDAARAVANALRQVEAPALVMQENAPEGE